MENKQKFEIISYFRFILPLKKYNFELCLFKILNFNTKIYDQKSIFLNS